MEKKEKKEIVIDCFDGGLPPKKATPGAAAFDLYTPRVSTVENGRGIIKLGFRMQLPEGYGALVFARSGFAVKGFEDRVGIRRDCDVQLGLIDEDYRGECGIIVHNNGDEFMVGECQRVAQMLIVKVEDFEFVKGELNQTERGEGGFGHSGTK